MPRPGLVVFGMAKDLASQQRGRWKRLCFFAQISQPVIGLGLGKWLKNFNDELRPVARGVTVMDMFSLLLVGRT